MFECLLNALRIDREIQKRFWVMFMMKHTVSLKSSLERSVEAACIHKRNVCKNMESRKSKIHDTLKITDF